MGMAYLCGPFLKSLIFTIVLLNVLWQSRDKGFILFSESSSSKLLDTDAENDLKFCGAFYSLQMFHKNRGNNWFVIVNL